MQFNLIAVAFKAILSKLGSGFSVCNLIFYPTEINIEKMSFFARKTSGKIYDFSRITGELVFTRKNKKCSSSKIRPEWRCKKKRLSRSSLSQYRYPLSGSLEKNDVI